MWFEYLTLLTALTISGVAAYYSIIGLTAIFAAAFWPIVIMGGVLEFGKIVTSVWLKKHWHKASWQLKSYLSFAVAVLMLITSMGIFGFLSKAHLDQNVPSGDVADNLAIIDEKIKTQKENIDAARKALKQMDESVDQTMARTTDDTGANRAASLRRAQQKERNQLQNDIAKAQTRITELNDQRAPIAKELRKVEAEVGPIKYVAALIYGDNPDANLLERAVRWVIIIIVAVFDPLAIALILAANSSMRWVEPIEESKKEEDTVELISTPKENCPKCGVELISAAAIGLFCPNKDCDVADGYKLYREYLQEKESQPDPVVVEDKVEPIVESSVVAEPTQVADEIQLESTIASDESSKVPETAPRYKAPMPVVPETKNVRRIPKLEADNVMAKPAKSSFGTAFPMSAEKGDLFLRVDHLPNKLYKFNGQGWMEVDKTKTDVHVYDNEYIQFLIDKLQSGEYELDQLSPNEQDLVADRLKQLTNEKT